MNNETPANLQNISAYLDANKPSLSALERLMKETSWGRYYVGKYYFRIDTNRSKASMGLNELDSIPVDKQKQLQYDNFPALFHEYIHYIHEISTVIGNVGLAIDTSMKALFSRYFDMDLNSAEHTGLKNATPDELKFFTKLWLTVNAIQGNDANSIPGIFSRVTEIDYETTIIYMPDDESVVELAIEVPVLTFEGARQSKMYTSKLRFGKYFIYEGLAYELELVADKKFRPKAFKGDVQKGTEYIVLRKLATYIIPGIEKDVYLTLASLSLSYLECGRQFISFLKQYKHLIETSTSKEAALQTLRQETSDLLSGKITDFNDATIEIVSAFEKRTQLHIAFSQIAEAAKNAYLARCEQPSFEVDFVLSGDITNLFSVVPFCDYMYVFTDQYFFNRDFLGSASNNEETASALKILIGYDDYQKKHQLHSTKEVEQKNNHQCPFYTCCQLQLRLNHSDICSTKPWRIFEISRTTDHQYCWYGTAVAELKGHTEP